MKRADYQANGGQFLADSASTIIGFLATNAFFAVDLKQRNAWLAIITQLKASITLLQDAYVFLEFTIPRMGRRVDAIILSGGCVFVLEYKVGAEHFSPADIDQVVGYALDLKNFHEPSHELLIFPILIATGALPQAAEFKSSSDGVLAPVLSNGANLGELLEQASFIFRTAGIDPTAWVEGRYKPTPTIIEAAQALYRNHRVDDITRSEAGVENLSRTASYVFGVIEKSKRARTKAICFITGVPGSGKTLAGLNIATLRTEVAAEEYAVFLSGNGPLVKVLRAALARDQKAQAKLSGDTPVSTKDASRKVDQFIQNIHHFRDANLEGTEPPIEKVVVFDEAQRAWNAHQTSGFMKRERHRPDFTASEPEFLLSVMDRHQDWCTVICLVGNGQEINTGEAGLGEWLNALRNRFPSWKIYLSERIVLEPAAFGLAAPPIRAITEKSLHLPTAIRSFRSEMVSSFASAIVDSQLAQAVEFSKHLDKFEFKITRDLNQARKWLRERRRGMERAGVLAFSSAIRLKAEGVFVKAKVNEVDWFLADRSDIRSSDYLEDVATEFSVQGLELDWACVCIDANLRVTKSGQLNPVAFRGTRWQAVHDVDRRKYIINAHRVLLTRARQGVVVFVPKGEILDPTRKPKWYDDIYNYFVNCGVTPISSAP